MHDTDDVSNPGTNPSFEAIMRVDAQRRHVLRVGVSAAAAAFLPWALQRRPARAAGTPPITFAPVPVSADDAVRVPAGYVAEVLYAWGDPVSDGPAFRPDASNSAADQQVQAGMHHDGMHYFALAPQGDGSNRGLLAVNHEYTDDGLLHPDGVRTWSAEKVSKSQAAHGVSVIEIRQRVSDGSWEVVRPSVYGRRITARTPMRVAGPAAGHPWLRTRDDPEGMRVLGTFNNCGCGFTPWGTYLACEENFQYYFRTASASVAQRRYGIGKTAGYRWEEHDERFDAERHPNEPNRFGWVVEIDPFDPCAVPTKRTALGRFSHEGAAHTLAPDGRVVIYCGDDQRNEYIYKFVSRDAYDPARPAANRDLLDHGTLYVARFSSGGTGEWLELSYGRNGLTAENGFTAQAEVLIHARLAADRAGATMMDRPEWIAVHPARGEVYCALTNNSRRGAQPVSVNAADGSTPMASANPPVDAANPRADNVFGHIVRWREAASDATSTRFEWEVFMQCGDPTHPDPARRGNIRGDAFGSPDGLWIDGEGRLWIQTDVSPSVLHKGDYARLGNNQMLCADPVTGEVRRFLTGPRGCEITGAVGAPDGRTLFVNIQHPGETPGERSDPAHPDSISSWPDGGRPRSATVAIRRVRGGIVGT